MQTPSSRARLGTLSALASLTLAACAHSSAAPPAQSPEPIVQGAVRLQVICPADLDQTLPEKPVPAPDAVVHFNAAGGAYLKALGVTADSLRDIILAARVECARPQGQLTGAAP